ncbi:helix-turn-helix domain-containing protein [Pseudomonas sp. GCM10022188]|uniref:helix-turn-helix domain-containing protein n=1 Tax=Pseudomonas TaxID=286 RepID=UPI001E35B024|nr:helix-turn-helix transcriptional regulator [Pseudomonas oryzagri]MCC6076046.1 helix-turn-helix domain-containing protein [Pseudomonas oryzagri]
MDQLTKALGAKIRAQRKARGLSQDNLAYVCGLDRSYMGRIERGEVNITIEKLYRLASALQCEPASLLPTIHQESPSLPIGAPLPMQSK